LKTTTRVLVEATEIRLRNNGTRVPANIGDKLFQPFFTTRSTGAIGF
jgi:nitrogen-specific signal transduction histidine kinase